MMMITVNVELQKTKNMKNTKKITCASKEIRTTAAQIRLISVDKPW